MTPMRFLVYAPIEPDTTQWQLGSAEYSYAFLLQRFLPVLRRMGDVVSILDPEAEADTLYRESLARGEDCRLLCFSPPHRSPCGLECPTTMIIVWEFDSIPDGFWEGDWRNDWRRVLDNHGQVITLSEYSKNVILKAMGPDFPVTVAPVPVFDSARRAPRVVSDHFLSEAFLEIGGIVIDTRALHSTTHHRISEEALGLELGSAPWDGSRVKLPFSEGAIWPDYLSLAGFYPRENWGCWSEAPDPWVILPFSMEGAVQLEILARGIGANIGRTISVSVGETRHRITLAGEERPYSFVAQLSRPTNLIKFESLKAERVPDIEDERSLALGLSSLTVERIQHVSEGTAPLVPQFWCGDRLTLHLREDAVFPEGLALSGFYPRERWGCWSQSSNPSISLPVALTGSMKIGLCVKGLGTNIGKEITVKVGNVRKTIILSNQPRVHDLVFFLEQPSHQIIFEGLDALRLSELTDDRTMALGLISISIEKGPEPKDRFSDASPSRPRMSHRKLSLEGVIYTSVIKPVHGNKNWSDIVKAFCFALRDQSDAVLILKFSHHSPQSFLAELMHQLRVIGPTRCRVVATNAPLEKSEYDRLISMTTYYVNASRCEGLCVPLMEFMSAGTPSIAPMHTAMMDYVNADSTFLIESSVEPCAWPQDPTARFTAFWHSISWESLARQFSNSYSVAKDDPEKYRGMSVAATSAQAAHSADSMVEMRMRSHFGLPSQ